MQLRSDVYRESDRIRVEIEVPGVRAEALELKVGRDRLLVRVHARPPVPGRVFHRRERGVGLMLRELPLPTLVSVDRVHAHLEDGILFVELPISSEADLDAPRASHPETTTWSRRVEFSAA